MASESELARQVMQELGDLAAGTDPSAEDGTDILARYQQLLVMLVDEDYADWPAGTSTSEDVIPAAAMPGLVQIVAYECAPMFGHSKAALVDNMGRSWKELGQIALRRYMRKKPTYERVMAEYF
jgi:hypothetical protein